MDSQHHSKGAVRLIVEPHKTKIRIAQNAIEGCLNRGMTDKSEIITVVADKLILPRPTVRQAKAGLIKRYKEYIKILEGEPRS